MSGKNKVKRSKKPSITLPPLTPRVVTLLLSNQRFADWYEKFVRTQTPPQKPRKSR